MRIIEYALPDTGRRRAAPRYRLATTILDPKLMPAEEFASLYAQRSGIEISFREVKITPLGREDLPT